MFNLQQRSVSHPQTVPWLPLCVRHAVLCLAAPLPFLMTLLPSPLLPLHVFSALLYTSVQPPSYIPVSSPCLRVCALAQVTMTDWAFVMYNVQDGVNWWTWTLHFFMCFLGGMLLM